MSCRRLFTLSWTRALTILRNPSADSTPRSRLYLSPEVVDSTVSNCPSDSIALSFFLWCARQPNYFHGPGSFDRIIPVVRRLTDRFGSVAGVVEELRSVGCSTKAQTFMVLLRIYWHSGLYKLALEVFDGMGSWGFVPNTFARNIVIDILFRLGHADSAMRFLRDTRSPNFLSYNIALNNLSKLGDWLLVRDVLRLMVKRGFHPNIGTFLLVFKCCRVAGKFAAMWQLLAFMVISGEQLTVPIWTILIDSLCRIHEFDKASTLLGEMAKSGCRPSVVTYTSLMKGLFQAKRHDEIDVLLHSMLSYGCKPDMVFYNVLMDCLSKAGRSNDALNIFYDLRESGLMPDIYTLSTLMSVLWKLGKTSLFPAFISRFDAPLDLVACNSVLNILCKAGFPSQAVEFCVDMVERGFTPDGYTLVGLLNGLCRSGRIDHAIKVYWDYTLNNPNLDAYVHAAVLNGLIKARKYYMGIRLFRKAVSENCHLDVVCYTIAANGLFRARMPAEACSLFDEMKNIGISPNIFTYNVMLGGLCKAKDIDAVKNLVKEMDFAGVEMDSVSFNTVIGLLIKLRRVRPASLLLWKMHELRMKPSAVVYSLLLQRLPITFGAEGSNSCQRMAYDLVENNIAESSGSDSSGELLCSSM